MQRTNRMIEAARGKGMELPGEWFTTNCELCGNGHHEWDCRWPSSPPRYTGPDLTLPENLHEALRLADALFDVPLLTGFNWETTGEDDIMRALGCTYSETDETIEVEGVGHIRIEAVNRACEKALGLPEWKEPTP